MSEVLIVDIRITHPDGSQIEMKMEANEVSIDNQLQRWPQVVGDSLASPTGNFILMFKGKRMLQGEQR